MSIFMRTLYGTSPEATTQKASSHPGNKEATPPDSWLYHFRLIPEVHQRPPENPCPTLTVHTLAAPADRSSKSSICHYKHQSTTCFGFDLAIIRKPAVSTAGTGLTSGVELLPVTGKEIFKSFFIMFHAFGPGM